ncbi:MAG: hypothetical protein GY936_18050 [Ignavibacteriae bacterium]|nr:hypothetical protein [Ignavibacteriota bacterium]
MKKIVLISFVILLFGSLFGCRESIVPPEEKDDPEHYVLSLRKILNPTVEHIVWERGGEYNIEWEITEHLENVVIKLNRKDYEEYIIAEKTVNNGSYQWIIPFSIPESHHYKIELISYHNPGVFTKSVEFEIADVPGG